MFSKLTLSYHHLDVKCWHKTRAADVASSGHLRDIIKELAIIMAANIVKSWHSFSIKCLYFPSQ